MRDGATSPRLIDSHTYNNVTFKRVDWTGLNVQGSNFISCTFEDVAIVGASFENCVFRSCLFDKVGFTRVVFAGGAIESTTFKRSLLGGTLFMSSGATAEGVVTTKPLLVHCTFDNVGLEGALFYCHGESVSFKNVTMKDTSVPLRGKSTLVTDERFNGRMDFDPALMVSEVMAPPVQWWPLFLGREGMEFQARVKRDFSLMRLRSSPTLLHSYVILIQNGVEPDSKIEKLLFVDDDSNAMECRRILLQLKTIVHVVIPTLLRLYKSKKGNALAAEFESLDVTDLDTVSTIKRIADGADEDGEPDSSWDVFYKEVEKSKLTSEQKETHPVLYDLLSDVVVMYRRLSGAWDLLLGGQLSGARLTGQLTLDSAMLHAAGVMQSFDKSFMPLYTEWLKAAQNPPTVRELAQPVPRTRKRVPVRARENARRNIRLPGGRAQAERKQLSDFNRADLIAGQRHEMEHTSDVEAALWIAADHLTEDPDYYRKLARLNRR